MIMDIYKWVIVIVEPVSSGLIRLIDGLLILLLIALRPCVLFGVGADLKQRKNVFHSLQLRRRTLLLN